MSTITLKDIPALIHRELKSRAKKSGRSLNREILAILMSAVAPHKVSVDELLAEFSEHRQSLPGALNDRLLEEARRTGRP
jgi:plasmid stability protein